MRAKGADWTPDKTLRLRKMMDEKLDFRIVAERMGVTPAAVQSKMTQLRRADREAAPAAALGLRAPPVKPAIISNNGLNFHTKGHRPPPPRAGVRWDRFKPITASVPTPFEDLKPRCCKWPVSDPYQPLLICCGAKAGHGAYCDDHEAMLRDRPATQSQDNYIAKRVMPAVRKAAA